jgi:hypothetical protein
VVALRALLRDVLGFPALDVADSAHLRTPCEPKCEK